MGGMAPGMALFLLYGLWRIDLVAVFFAWLILSNGPHVFATYTRTYLSRDEWARRGGILRLSLGVLLVGPAVLGICVILGNRLPFLLFMAGVGLWAFWHTARQHYGILRLYQRKTGDGPGLDALLLHVGLIAPFLVFFTSHAEVRRYFGAASLPDFRAVAAVAVAAVAAVWLGRLAWQWIRGVPIHVPKVLFLGTVVPYYAIIFGSTVLIDAPFFGIVPIVILPHDVQYHAMVWFYNRNRGEASRRRGEIPDLGCRLTTRLPIYAACAVATGGLLALLSCSLDSSLGCLIPLHSVDATRLASSDLLLALFHGVFAHHYFVDQFIWRPSRDPDVAQGLGLPVLE